MSPSLCRYPPRCSSGKFRTRILDCETLGQCQDYGWVAEETVHPIPRIDTIGLLVKSARYFEHHCIAQLAKRSWMRAMHPILCPIARLQVECYINQIACS